MDSTRLISLSLWRLIVTVCVGMLLLAGAGVWYTQHAVAEEARKQCGVYTLLDSFYRASPPPTGQGRAFAAVIHKVVTDLGCKE